MRALLIILFAVGTAGINAAAAGRDSVDVSRQMPVNMAQPLPGERSKPSFYNYHVSPEVHRNHVATGLLISGGACLAVGVPLLISGLNGSFNDEPNKPGISTLTAISVAGGGLLSIVGTALTVPGIVLKIQYAGSGRRRHYM